MVKRPDMSEITKKLNLPGLMKSVRSMINPEGRTPKPEAGDAWGEKFERLSIILQQMMHVHEEQAKELEEANQLLNEIFVSVNAAKKEISPDTKG